MIWLAEKLPVSWINVLETRSEGKLWSGCFSPTQLDHLDQPGWTLANGGSNWLNRFVQPGWGVWGWLVIIVLLQSSIKMWYFSCPLFVIPSLFYVLLLDFEFVSFSDDHISSGRKRRNLHFISASSYACIWLGHIKSFVQTDYLLL